MMRSIIFSVRLHEGWYHGAGSMPSPARMFQALVAGRGISGPFGDDARCVDAIKWLEQSPPPIVALPATKRGQSVVTYVPNNDLDSKQGDPRRIGEIRTKKVIRPLLFDETIPFLYCWQLPDDAEATHIEQLEKLADGVYQLGRGVDAAWAVADVVSDEELDLRLQRHPGPVLHPATGQGTVQCPTAGSLDSLIRRHDDLSRRFGTTMDHKGQTFRRRSKPKWQMVSYDSKPARACYQLSDQADDSLIAWPLTQASRLAAMVRDAAAQKLTDALPERATEIQQTLIGRKPDGTGAGPPSARVRIIPLPSVGHVHADPGIRRLLIEIPSQCPLQANDVLWGFAGQQFDCHNRTTLLVPADPHRQLQHYGIDSVDSRHWQTVTPIALSSAPRRRVEPNRAKRTQADLKPASERRLEQEQAMAALKHALRHAGVPAAVTQIRLQREPFTQVGRKADDFADGRRFTKHTLWHAALTFDRPLSGPLLIGDGRFMGLGLMKPVVPSRGIYCFSIDAGLSAQADPLQVANALRLAVMACVRDETRSRRLDPFFTGHRIDGARVKSAEHPHLAFTCDLASQRVLIVSPSAQAGTIGRREQDHLRTLESALQRLHTVRAGRNGRLSLRESTLDDVNDPLLRSSRTWTTVAPYCVSRHAKKTTAEEVIRRDVLTECSRRGLPQPTIHISEWNAVPRIGLQAELTLTFATAVSGPILLGKTRYKGGGLFTADAPNP